MAVRGRQNLQIPLLALLLNRQQLYSYKHMEGSSFF